MRERVHAEEADPRPLPQAEVVERGADGAHPRGELRIGQRALAVHHGGPPAVHERGALQWPAEVAHSPSSLTAFSFSTSGRTSSRISSFAKSASQRSGVISG